MAMIDPRLEPVRRLIHGEDAGPEDPGELLERAEEPEELARLVARDQAGEQRPAQGLGPALHRPDQDGQERKWVPVVMK